MDANKEIKERVTICKKEPGSFHLMVRKSKEDLNLYCLDAYPCIKCSKCVTCNISDTCSACYKSKEQKLKDDRKKLSVDVRRIIRQDSKETMGYHPSAVPSQLKKLTRSEESQQNIENKDRSSRDSISEKRKSKSMESLNEEEVD